MALAVYFQSDIKRQLCNTAIGVIVREQDPIASRSALLALCSVGAGFGIPWRDLCSEISLGLPGYSTQQVANIAAVVE